MAVELSIAHRPRAAAAAQEQMVPRPYRVAERRQDTADTWTLTLTPTAEPLAPFAPGQFAMVYAFGVGEVPISIGRIGADGVLVQTVRAVGKVSEAICAAEPGSVLGLRGPFGTPWPVSAAEGGDVVVAAGGVGLPPVRPILDQVAAARERYGNVTLLYGARTPDDLLFTDEYDAWRERFGVEVTVDRADTGWRGAVGVVTTLLGRARFDPARTHAFVCGPEVMMRFTAQALLDRGLAPERVNLSMERNMACGLGHCGRCQLGPVLVCRDGPVFTYAEMRDLMGVRML